MRRPLVTVIITAYNQEDFIGPALESVSRQDYENLEIVACDDASTDETPSILRDWADRDPRVRVVVADRNAGLSENRNRGLRISRGELIALLDGDDLMRDGKITAQVERLEADPSAAGCVHDAEIFESSNGSKLGLFSQYSGARGLREGGVELWLNPTYVVLPSTMMFRSRLVPKHLFDTRLPFTADWLFSIELFRRGDCLVLPGVYVDYRRHSSQMTTDSAKKGFEEGMIIMGIVDARYPELAHLTRTMRAALLLGEARRRARAGERPASIRYARSAALAGGFSGHARLVRQMVEARWRRPSFGPPSSVAVDESLGLDVEVRPESVRQFEEHMMALAIRDVKHPESARRTSSTRRELLEGEARRRALLGDHAGATRFARSAAQNGGVAGRFRSVCRASSKPGGRS